MALPTLSDLAAKIRSYPSLAAQTLITQLSAITDSIAGLSADGTFSCLSSVAKGHVVYVDSADHVAKADADAPLIPAIGVVASKPGTTTALVRFSGVITGAGSFTAGALQYLSTTAGALTETAPAAPNAAAVGIAVNTTDLLVFGSGPISYMLRAVTAALGANVVGYDDSGSKTAAATVADALDEIYVDLTSGNAIIPINLQAGMLAAGTPLTTFADNASSNPGTTLANSKAKGVQWNDNATQTAVWYEVVLPSDLDTSQPLVLVILASKTGATVGDATKFTVSAFAQTVSALHDAGSDLGGDTGAMTGNATAKTVQRVTYSIASPPTPVCGLSFSIKPKDGTLGTDDVIAHAAYFLYTRKLRTS